MREMMITKRDYIKKENDSISLKAEKIDKELEIDEREKLRDLLNKSIERTRQFSKTLPKDGTHITVLVPVRVHWKSYKPKSIQAGQGKEGRWVDAAGAAVKFDPEKLQKAG